MNITEALNAALPEIPARTMAQRYPRIPPDAVFKEQLEEGKPIVRVLIPSADAVYRFPPQNWALVQLFDGRRSYDEIAQIYSVQIGSECSPDDIREFAASLESMEFWYKTPQEKNIILMQKSSEERQKLLKRKNRYADLSQILFPAVNPDKFLTWLHHYTSFIYTGWFTVLTLIFFAITAGITITHWSEIGRDTLQFFNFSAKTWGDVGVFYLLALVTMCWHEIGHGHACKHYGGRVPSMGFLLIYLTPAFYTDTGEGFVRASRPQRLIISLAGAWSELYICSVATLVWWGTAPNTSVHNAAYLLLLITGIASLAINWNPLMKLDGYHMFCEIIGVTDLKETSTAYVSAWVKHFIWRLPVEVPYIPKRRRLIFAAYALLSGFYSYTVLYVVARFVGNIFRNFNPDWSFIPELGTAALIFKSRIRTLVNFMKFVYLDKKDRVREWLTSGHSLATAVVLILVLAIPVWHDSVEGHFVLEPASRSVLRNQIPGSVARVYVHEGMAVSSGDPLLQLRNLPLQSELARGQTEFLLASIHANSAALNYTDFGAARQEREAFALQNREIGAEAANLLISSPISGVILTPRLDDRLGSYVPAGTELVEVADLRHMRARVYVSEHDVYKLKVGAHARLAVEGFFHKWNTNTESIAPVSTEIAPGLTDATQYKGLRPPNFYLVDLQLENENGELRPGMVGTARIYGSRRSLIGLGTESVTQFFARKAW